VPATPSTTFGDTTESTIRKEPPPTFTIPGLYGAAPTTLVGGQGRLARPTFRYNGSVTFGLDDNVFATPFNAETVPAVTQEVVVTPAVPDRQVIVRVFPSGRPKFFGERPIDVPITIPGTPAKTQTVVLVPAITPQPQTFSFVARSSIGTEIQFASRTTVFTLDANISASYYTNRHDPVDYNGSLTFAYLHRISSRLSFSASANIAYLSQPDPGRVNSPLTQVGDYFVGGVKTDLSYRWTKRFSTVTSLSANATMYSTPIQQLGDFNEVLIGNEARYLLFPRLTVLGEVRYGVSLHPNDPLRDSHQIFLLFGSEFPITRRMLATVRLGTQSRTFDDTGETKIGPFSETSLTWQYHRAGSLVWTTRLGFEEPPGPNTTVQAFRSTVNLVQAFSARLKATGGVSAGHTITTDNLTDQSTNVNVFSIDAGMEYMLTRNMTLTGSYTFTGLISSAPSADYIRNQIFFGLRYSF
jgi:hypothetical protein